MNNTEYPGDRFRSALLPVLAGGLLLASCNKKEADKTETEPVPDRSGPCRAPRLIEITGNDQMQFSTKAFDVESRRGNRHHPQEHRDDGQGGHGA